MTEIEKSTAKRVRRQYESYPYPNYPLLARPRFQDGYMCHPGFTRALLNQRPAIEGRRRILVIGCGEMLPFIFKMWSSSGDEIYCVDLSSKSLKRAKFRSWPFFKNIYFVNKDISEFLDDMKAKGIYFDHVDSYGVFMCFSEPRTIIRKLAQSMSPGATARFMVYNSPARNWITHTAKILSYFNLDPYKPKNLTKARKLLSELSRHVPVIQYFLSDQFKFIFKNDARLVDTFFHEREIRLKPSRWFEIFTEAGFDLIGLFDRYGELDDLINPLVNQSRLSAIDARAADRRFENNLEVFLTLNPARSSQSEIQVNCVKAGRTLKVLDGIRFLRLAAKYPLIWYTFSETREVSLIQRYLLWWDHLLWVKLGKVYFTPYWKGLPFHALMRLCRLGAILPGMLSSDHYEKISKAMTTSMETPRKLDHSNLDEKVIDHVILSYMNIFGVSGERRKGLIKRRLMQFNNEFSMKT